MPQKSIFFFFFLLTFQIEAQEIKTIQLQPNQENVYTSIVPFGTVLTLSFDDLEADSKDYYYQIDLMTHDWEPTRLLANQYIDGFQKNVILNYSNSFNTLQNYTHYKVKIPNENTRITVSGNYLVSVLNEYDELVFSRRFTLYEQNVIVGVEVQRSRDTKTFDTEQTVEFTVNYPNLRINNPDQEINVAVLQNNNWNTAKTNLQPTFYKNNQLVYSYTKNSNFAGGNEYLNFDNKILRNKSLNTQYIELRDVWHHFLYPFEYSQYQKYTYNPDINGQFLVRTLEGNNPQTEADYANVNFALTADESYINKEIYVFGAFNNFEISEENKMTFDKKNNLFTADILLKQGFYNYTFVSKDSNKKGDITFLIGNHYQTENEYTVLVYYKPFGGLFDRVAGVGTTIFRGER